MAIEGFVGKGGAVGDVPPRFGREVFVHLRDVIKAFGKARPGYDGRKNLYFNQKFDWPNNRKTVSTFTTILYNH